MHLIQFNNLLNDSFQELDQLFNQALSDSSRYSYSGFGKNRVSGFGGFKADVFSDDQNYYVVAELPGIPKEAVSIQLEQGILTISGERTSKEDTSEKMASFQRAITVGDDVDAEQVSAQLENGLLTVTLPKVEARKPKTITVN